MDRMDERIVAALQADGRLSFKALARLVNLSAPSVAERVRRLEDRGVVTGYRAQVDASRMGRPVQAVIRMDCYGPTCILRDESVRSWPELRSFYRVTGDGCSVLVVAVESMLRFEELIDRLATYGQPSSSMILADLLPWAPVQPAGS